VICQHFAAARVRREIHIVEDRLMQVAIDTGGTFTDAVVLDDKSGSIEVIKVPSTPSTPGEAVMTAIAQVRGGPEAISRVILGSTIGLNALLQRAGADVVFLTTAGFEDIPHIQRISRPRAYDIQWVKPEPLVRRSATVGVNERIDHTGTVLTPLSDEEVARVLDAVRLLVDRVVHPAIAVSLLFSYVNPAHELRLLSSLRESFPDVPVSISSHVAPVWREHERASTTIADAYVKPLISSYAGLVEGRLRSIGVTAPVSMMLSNGGQTRIEHGADHSAQLLLSGLAGGLVAGTYYANLLNRPNLVTLDMGGTSADVGMVYQSRLTFRESYDIEFALPVVGSFIDMTTIGAGGSSIVAFDRGGLLTVGPESAGADPGPAAYGRGGFSATVTDANLILGRLDPEFFLGGQMPLSEDLAVKAMMDVASNLGSSVEDAALAVVRLANENMANAVRLLTVDRGLDHRAFDLLAFGGAGPLHASELASALGMSRVIVPIHPGLTSAFGLLVAPPRVDRRVTRELTIPPGEAGSLKLPDLSAQLRSAYSDLVTSALDEVRHEGYDGPVDVVRTVSMRYWGQNYEQEVPLPSGDITEDTVRRLVDAYHAQHEVFYGYAMRDHVCELIHLNVSVVGLSPGISLPAFNPPTPPQPIATRRVLFYPDGWLATPIYLRSELPAHFNLIGPAIIQELDSTTLVSPGQHLEVDPSGVLFMAM
jgi:N-methylhydantoinase A